MFDFEKGNVKFLHGGKYPHCHGIFIDDQIRAVIDPASDESKLKAIQQERPVDILINSHSHEDHMLYNYLFAEAELWVHPLDDPPMNDIHCFIEQFDMPSDMDEKTTQQWQHFLTEEIHYSPRAPDRLLNDGEVIEFGQTRMQVLHTPGHTPGHLSFYFPEEKVLFSGDLDMVKFGPYYGDKASSIDATIESLERLATIEVETYLSAHGREGVLDGDPEHIRRYLKVIYKREEALLDFLTSGPQTLEAVIERGIIYGGRTLAEGAWDLAKSEKSMMMKHLERLESRGSITKEDGLYRHV